MKARPLFSSKIKSKVGLLWAVLVLGTIFGAFRVQPAYETVFGAENRVKLLGVDAYFHVRHSQYSVEHFPEHLRLDPASHFPSDEYQEYSGLFNLTIAAATNIIQPLFPDKPVLEAVSAWLPVLLGIVSLAFLVHLAYSLWGVWAGFAAGTMYTLYPGYSLSRTTLGFGDQHAAEMLLAIAALWGFVRATQTAQSKVDSNNRFQFFRPALIYALPFAAFFYTWIGHPMYVAILGISMVALVLGTLYSGDAATGFRFGIFRFFSGVVVWQVFVLVFFPTWRMQWMPNIHFLILAAMSFCALFPFALLDLYERSGWLQQHRKRTVWILSASILIGLVLFFKYTSMGSGFWFWLSFERDQGVREQQDFSWFLYFSMYGLPGILALFAPIMTLLNRSRGAINILNWSALFFGGGCIAIWARTHDFDYIPAIFIALLAAQSLTAGLEIIKRWDISAGLSWSTMQSHHAKLAACALAVALFVLPIWPLRLNRTPWILKKEVESLLIYDDPWHEAMEWLQVHTTTSPTTNQSTPLDLGVMSAWDHGNIIAYKTNLAPVYSRYPSNGDAIWMTSTDERDAIAMVCPSCAENETVRYAAVSYRLASDLFLTKAQVAGRNVQMQQEGLWNRDGKNIPRITFGEAFDQSLITKMFKYNGSGLQQHRLIYESIERHLIQTVYDASIPELRITSDPFPDGIEPPTIGNSTLTQKGPLNIYDVHVAPAIRIFEMVDGALIRGTSKPNERILLRNRLASSRSNREYEYQQVSQTDSTGVFEFRVPYSTPTSSPSSGLTMVGLFQIIAQQSGSFEPVFVSEMNVTHGDTLWVSK